MKQAYKLLLPLLGLPLIAATLADWVTFNIDKQVSVQTPAQPEELDLAKLGLAVKLEGTKIYNAKDVIGFYQTIRVNDSGTESGPKEVGARKAFYEGVITGLLNQQNGVLLERSSFPTAGGEGIEIKYRSLDKRTGKQAIKYTRSLLVGKTSYSLNFLSLDGDTTGTSGTEQRQRFFNSITVKP